MIASKRPSAPSPQPPLSRREAGASTASAQRRRRGRGLLPYLLLGPATAFMLVVHFVPMAAGLWMSLLHLNQAHLADFLGAPFVGLANYAYVLLDPLSPVRNNLLDALRNTLIYTVSTNVLTLVMGLGAALLITREFRGRGIVRTLLLLPWIVPTYVVGVLFGFMWQPFGIVNHLLHDVLHLPVAPFWLVGPLTMVAIVVPTVWRGFPQTMMMLAAGLSSIPQDLYEAAEVDGAGAWQRLRHVTLPMLRPVIAVIVLFTVIFSVYSFNIVWAMFGGGNGYPGQWGDLLMTMIFRYTFSGANFGIGAAASAVLLLVCVALVAIWYWTFRKEVTIR